MPVISNCIIIITYRIGIYIIVHLIHANTWIKESITSRKTPPATPKSPSASVTAATIATNTSADNNNKIITIIKTKIENATEGLPYSCFNYLYNRVLLPASSEKRGSKENALTATYAIIYPPWGRRSTRQITTEGIS